MSKNFELIQQADVALGGVPRVASANGKAEARKAEAELAGTIAPTVREECLKLVQQLFLNVATAPKAVIFAPIDAADGCGKLCAATAEILADNVAGSVCLVDANFRSPSLPPVLEAEGRPGLFDSLRSVGSIRDFASRVRRDNFYVMGSGSLKNDPSSLLNSGQMKERVAELRREFDYVLMAAPPMSTYLDALVLAQLADGLVLVLEANATRREAALRVANSLKNSKVQVLGAVLNNRTFPIPASVYRRI
jgi:Mrp family chromosome partitioning ATPase